MQLHSTDDVTTSPYISLNRPFFSILTEILNWTIFYWMQKVIVKSRISVCAKKASVGELQPPLFAEPLTTSHLRWMSQLFCPRKKESKITIIQLHSSSQEFICIVKRHKILRFYKSYCLLLKKNFGVKLWTQHFLPNCNWILNFFSDFARIGLWCQCRLVGARCPHVWNDGRSTSVWGR